MSRTFFAHAILFMTVSSLKVYSEPLSAVKIEPHSQPLQELLGWGLTPAYVDANGDSVSLPMEYRKLVYNDLGATVIRAVVGAGLYDEKIDSGELHEALVDRRLNLQIEDAGAQRATPYILSIATPPSAMKKYDSDLGEVDSDPNTLRPEFDQEYCDYIVRLLNFIRQKGRSLPIALSLQIEPNWASPDEGCFYSPERWSKFLVEVRSSLDKAGMNSVALIGPETSNVAAAGPYVALLKKQKELCASLAGIAVRDSSKSYSDAETYEFKNSTSVSSLPGRSVWMLGADLLPAYPRTDPTLVEQFSRMGRDLVENRCSYWFWAVGPRLSASSLGDTSIFQATQFLWNHVPIGSFVRSFESSDPTVRTKGIRGIDVFGFSNPKATIIVICNGTASERPFEISGMNEAIDGRYWTENSSAKIQPSSVSKNSSVVQIKPESVTVLIFGSVDKPNSERSEVDKRKPAP